MSSSYPTTAREDFDARWSEASGDVLIEVKRTSNARDVRDALLALAYALKEEDSNVCALCVLVKTRLSEQRLHEELTRFRSVVRSIIGGQIYLAAVDEEGRFIGSLPPASPEIKDFIMATVRAESVAGRASRQTVKAYLVESWLGGLGPQTIAKLRHATGASYPTAAAALQDLRSLGALSEDRHEGAMLREPSWDAWRRLAEAQSADRKIIRFVDPSGQARPPSKLERRLQHLLQQKDWAEKVELGGVLGAQVYYPDLDVTAAPRLDLCVYNSDIGFMRKLDAALVKTDDPESKPVVVLHLTRKISAEPHPYRRAHNAASPLDCMADLLEIGYQAEARDFALTLARLPWHSSSNHE